jgi:hypothetical protein
MTTMKQICCAAGLCLSIAMLLALANHDQRSERLKLSPRGVRSRSCLGSNCD